MLRNRRFQNNIIVLLGLVGLVLTGCEGFFGKKVDASFIDVPIATDRPVAYVPIQPVWDNFTRPADIIIGYDELIYVVDDVTEEIIALDQAGNELGRFGVPGVHDIAMDRRLELLALGTFDTLGATLPAIYRIDLKSNGGAYGLSGASIVNKVLHPFYYKSSFTPGVDDLADFTGIATRADNSYYVSRSGPNVSQIFGPDDAMLIFGDDDDYATNVRVNTAGQVRGDYFISPVAVVTKAQPPQSPFVNTEGDFIFASTDATQQLKVRYIDVEETENGITYLVQEFAVGDTSAADGFLYTPGRFGSPTDVTFTGDGTNYIFVLDQEKDSLFQFTNTGLEGVNPPAGSSSSKNIKVSFGGTGSSLTEFRQPTGVAYYRRIVYVADAGNGRVLRFQLTTDFD
ncbi:MAG: hypothetical protein AAGN35_02790 [Bacteroidota bacterium]